MNLNREELRSAVIGMVLGDGSLTKRWKNGEAYFQMSHAENQYDYLLWKQTILNNITNSTVHPTKKIINGKECNGFHLGTMRHPFFTKLYYRFYHNSRKVVDEYLVKKINSLALAIWYMDDGGFGHDKARPQNEVSYYLNTNCFDYANQLLLKKSLKINFDLDWNLNKAEKANDGTYHYRLRLARHSNDKFIDIIKNLLVPCMQYKIIDSNANQLY